MNAAEIIYVYMRGGFAGLVFPLEGQQRISGRHNRERIKVSCNEAAFLSTDASSQVFTAGAVHMTAFWVLKLFSKIGCYASDEHVGSLWRVTEAGLLGICISQIQSP